MRHAIVVLRTYNVLGEVEAEVFLEELSAHLLLNPALNPDLSARDGRHSSFLYRVHALSTSLCPLHLNDPGSADPDNQLTMRRYFDLSL